MRLKNQEQSELNFVSRIIQIRLIGFGNYPRRAANGIKHSLESMNSKACFGNHTHVML